MKDYSRINLTIKKKLIYIRKLRISDINNNYLHWFGQKQAKFIESKSLMNNLENLKKYFKFYNLKKNVLFLGVFSKYYSEHIANIKFEFDEKSKSATLGIFIGNKKYLGKGYGKLIINEACLEIKKVLGIKIFYLGVNNNNVIARKLYKNIGFKIVSKNYTDKSMKLKWICN